MKKIFLIIIYLCLVTLSSAQYASFKWAKNMGAFGTSSAYNDCGRSISIDPWGNVYSTGYFNGVVDFDPGTGVFNLSSAGFNDIYISKLDSSGNFVWAKRMGYGLNDEGNSIAVDASGNVYTAGHFQDSIDFDPGAGVCNLISHSGSKDIFISKLDASGNFLWAKSMGGTSSDDANFIAVDQSGFVYTTGYFHDTVDFDPGAGTYNLATDSSVFSDIFISKLDSSGNFVWAKKLGGTSISGSSSNAGNSIAFDPAGNVYTTGFFQGTVDFDPGSGVFNLGGYGYGAQFISKLDSSGNFVWAKNTETSGVSPDEVVANSIAVDTSGNVYTTGFFKAAVDFDPGLGTFILSTSSVVDPDIFISKLDPSGNFLWTKDIGGNFDDSAFAIVLDVSGYLYITGSFRGTVDFDPGPATFALTSNGYTDVFILKVDSSGNFLWAKAFGGLFHDAGRCVAVDTFGNIYTTGSFIVGADFDPDANVFGITGHNGSDIFVQKMSQGSTGESVTEITNNNKIDIYPNPSTGIFNVLVSSSLKNGKIQVYNSMGELVYDKGIANELNIVEILNQAQGLYFVRVVDKVGFVATKKIVKE